MKSMGNKLIKAKFYGNTRDKKTLYKTLKKAHQNYVNTIKLAEIDTNRFE